MATVEHKSGKRRVYVRPNIPESVKLRASLKPIISKGPFSLVWVNPDPNPVDLHPEQDDWDPQEGVED
jgi:hypothetical protein